MWSAKALIMTEKITNYQCPNCTGPLRYDGGLGMLKCDHCGTEFDVAVVEKLYADKEQAAAAAGNEPEWNTAGAGSEWGEDEARQIRVYNCPSCSAQLFCEETTAVTSCPYCGNPSVVPGQLSGVLKPDYVIPFKLDKQAAVSALTKYYKKKKFLPKAFSVGNHIEEIKGVYVPFWLYDGESDANIRYHATMVHKHRHGDYETTVTEHFRVERQGSIDFEKVPVDASTKMPDAHMDSIEPFEYGDIKDFSTAYLPGFMADKYDQDADECSSRANIRIRKTTENEFASTAPGYTTLVPEYTDIRLKNSEVRYALLPVWMLSTKWKDKDFLFAMNGQTGKLIGDLPVSRAKFWLWFFGISLPLMVALGIILFMAF